MFSSFEVNAEDQYIQCSNTLLKITDPFIGSGKMYYQKRGEWILRKDGKVTKDTVISYGYKLPCADKPPCRVKRVISRLLEPDGKVKQREFAMSDCEQRYGQSCIAYDEGDQVNSYYCTVLKRE